MSIIALLILTTLFWFFRSKSKILHKRYYLDMLLQSLFGLGYLYGVFRELQINNLLSAIVSLLILAIGIYHFVLVFFKLQRIDNRYRWIHKHNRAIVNYDIPHEEFVVNTADGIRIHGVSILNASAPADKAIVVCHGASRTKYTAPIVQTCMILALEHNVFCFDFRGHMESTGTFYLDGEEIDRDLTAVINYVREQGYSSIGVVGWSIGGASALRCARELSIQVLVAGSPPMEMPDISEMRLMLNPLLRLLIRPIMLVTRQVVLSVHGKGKVASTTMEKARQLPAIPMLLAYNDYDYVLRIDGEQFENYFAELPSTKTLLKLPGRGHLFDWPNNYIFWEYLMSWLRENFKGAA